MKTEIISNGSKWAGQEPDSIEKLIEVLNNHDLDIAMFGAFGFIDFVNSNGYSNQDYREHTVRIHGNFFDISHVFNIEGIYRNLQPVIDAIEANLKRQSDRLTRSK